MTINETHETNQNQQGGCLGYLAALSLGAILASSYPLYRHIEKQAVAAYQEKQNKTQYVAHPPAIQVNIHEDKEHTSAQDNPTPAQQYLITQGHTIHYRFHQNDGSVVYRVWRPTNDIETLNKHIATIKTEKADLDKIGKEQAEREADLQTREQALVQKEKEEKKKTAAVKTASEQRTKKLLYATLLQEQQKVRTLLFEKSSNATKQLKAKGWKPVEHIDGSTGTFTPTMDRYLSHKKAYTNKPGLGLRIFNTLGKKYRFNHYQVFYKGSLAKVTNVAFSFVPLIGEPVTQEITNYVNRDDKNHTLPQEKVYENLTHIITRYGRRLYINDGLAVMGEPTTNKLVNHQAYLKYDFNKNGEIDRGIESEPIKKAIEEWRKKNNKQ